MDELKSKNIDSLFDCAETTNNIFAVVYRIANNYNYPKSAQKEIVEAVQNLNNQIFRVCNFIYNPDAENFIDAVAEKENQIENQIKNQLN
jgi:hypothetical protein